MYIQHKQKVWQVIASRFEGWRVCELTEWISLSQKEIEDVVDDLHVEGNIYFERRTGRWYAEMAPPA